MMVYRVVGSESECFYLAKVVRDSPESHASSGTLGPGKELWAEV